MRKSSDRHRTDHKFDHKQYKRTYTTTTTRLNQVAFPSCDQFRSRAQWSTCRCMANTLVPHVCGESARCARSGATSRWRSRFSFLRCNTIRTAFYGTRGQPPEPGERHELFYTAMFRERLPPREAGQHLCLRLQAGRIVLSGTSQTVEQLPNVVQFFAALSPVPEQVLEVTKTLPHDVPLRRFCRQPQLVEQPVEVPTIVSFSSLQRTMEQNVVIPVVCGSGAGGGLYGLHPGQSSSAFGAADHRFPAATAEQIVDIPGPRGAPLDFHQVPLRAAGSSGLPGTTNQWVFRTFSRDKKVRRPQPSRVRACPTVSAHRLGRLKRTWTLRTSRRYSRTRTTRSSCLRSLRTRAAGSCLQQPRVVAFWHRGRAGPCGTSLPGASSRRRKGRRRGPG